MIRKLMLALGLFTLTGASAMAAPAAVSHAKTHRIATTEDPTPPPPDAKKAKKTKKAKKDKAPEGGKDAPAK
jgi:hypothetical protein